MSCNCGHQDDGSQFPCHCDDFVFPEPLHIGAGLRDIPRQIAGFPEYRRDMLYTLRSKVALADWHATKPDDMGLMLLEMWAYVCDVVSFYDKVIAEELYIGTANQRPSLRKLVALLGYLPAPAVAATAQLAAKTSGRQPLAVPAGTAFRSGAFNGNPPQVFELGQAAVIDLAANSWNIVAPHLGIVMADNPSSLLVKATLVPNAGDMVLLVDTADASKDLGLMVSGTSNVNGNTLISFAGVTNLKKGKALSELRLLLPRATANILKDASAATVSAVMLDSVARQIKVSDKVLISGTGGLRAYTVLLAVESTNTGPGTTVTINGSSFTTPGATSPVTILELDGGLAGWTNPATAQLILHYNLQSVGAITDLPKTMLADTDALILSSPAEAPAGDFLVQDANLYGAAVSGMVVDDVRLQLNAGEGWSPDLALPVQVFGNVLKVSRGQKVSGEILGNGDATQANQGFKLQKKPLTYLPAPSAENNSGVKSTLAVHVGGIRWAEVASFYGKGQNDQVYIVRQNDDGDSLIIFGDGIRGQRLPAGVSNIVANYRYGAGAAAPPAGSINQIYKPVKGLQSVNNITAAGGGADAEGPDSLRENAPKSALILGRAVSIQDLEAVALVFPGVITAQAEWRWEKDAQAALVHVWYIGDVSIAPNLYKRLKSLSDPTVVIQVDNAVAIPVSLVLSVDVDPRYVEDDVHAAVKTALMGGLLAPGFLGIGNPLFRSQLFEAVLEVEGTVAVSGVLWNGVALHEFAKTPGSGYYFDFTVSL